MKIQIIFFDSQSEHHKFAVAEFLDHVVNRMTDMLFVGET